MNKKSLLMRKRKKKRAIIAAGAFVSLASVIALASVFALNAAKRDDILEETSPSSVPETETHSSFQSAVSINGISIQGMDYEEASSVILSQYPWNISVSYGDETIPVPNFMETSVSNLLNNIFSEDLGGDFTIDSSFFENEIREEVKGYASKWDISPKSSVIDAFNPETNRFTFHESSAGTAIDQEKLVSDISAAFDNQDFDAVIPAVSVETQPKLTTAQAKDQYTTLATFTTTTTANPKRNTNVRLSAEALNGTIVQPGEEFSFNAVVGPRTAEKGYQEASAYSSGQVVQEIGGGVCQISSTLYRVAFRSAMNISFRRSHTFEPNYVTPGQDATISWEQPDFRFINTSSAPIGIKASYADQKATVSIVGIPVLEEGVTWDLYSEKAEELEPPAPTYIEDPTLEPGVEIVQSAGTRGSRWITYKVVSKNGVEVERVEDHSKTYKGHAPVIRRNTSGTVLSPEETLNPQETSASDAVPPVVDGMEDDVTENEIIESETVQ